MSDQQKVTLAIQLATDQCNQALLLIQSHPPPQSHTLHILRKDLLSLLALLKASSTKITLSLKPSSPAYKTALVPLQDTATHISALAQCYTLFTAVHGQTLLEELTPAVQGVINSYLPFLDALKENITNPQGSEEYILRTGMIHQVIDRVTGLSVDNQAAVKKRWVQDREQLEDGFRELGEMLEDTDDDADADDGWDELGLGTSKKLTEVETKRTKSIHTIIRLTTLLHKRILLDILSPTHPAPIPNALLDTLLTFSTSLLTSYDDLISSLYPPHVVPVIIEEVHSFGEIVTAMQGVLSEVIAIDISADLERLSLSGGKTWFATCFEQIHKGLAGVE